MPHIKLPFGTNACFPNQSYLLKNMLMCTTNPFPIAYAHHAAANIVNMQPSEFVPEIAQPHQHEAHLHVVDATTCIPLLQFAHPPWLQPFKCPLAHTTFWVNFLKAQEERGLQKPQRRTSGTIWTLICKPCTYQMYRRY
jgi:hypothetical protein